MSLARAPVRLVHPGRHPLGEGPFWHDGRERLFWFSILEGRLLSCDAAGDDVGEWALGERASAAGIVDRDRLLVATETGLWTLDLREATKTPVEPLEAGNPRTRSNDGRTAPDGAFWIGTMGLDAEPGAGAVYRYAAGERPPLAVLRRRVGIPNAICFAPDGRTAYLADTTERTILAWDLDGEGAPRGEPRVHIDLREDGLNPDGAVVDTDGCLWNAQWGAGRVARYDPDGAFMGAVAFPVSQVSCPAFGGEGLSTLFVTTAAVGLPEGAEPDAGSVFAVEVDARGRAEPRVRVPEPVGEGVA